jgi:hypothetical protein
VAWLGGVRMIGKKVPTKDGTFRIEVSKKEIEKQQQISTTDFFAEWAERVVPKKPKKSSIEEMPLTIFELDNDNNPIRVFETTVKSASMELDGVTYDIPLDMAIAAIQNMDETSEITYNKKEENE